MLFRFTSATTVNSEGGMHSLSEVLEFDDIKEASEFLKRNNVIYSLSEKRAFIPVMCELEPEK